ncbi:M56 family metallopeptidase [Streptomyces angustmyceticus]|uniref:Membrane protein n=1 Tax=Streptomyces angustmyceticus TaxID=285578 RepID=A0A5J4LRQ1_9ACTN|nr:M56 family metallopeptidase [Streptomyces angustmyceticus]UAL70270.1 M56 family metallopeptidase [Streptomyces angustmyceticus]GES34212.1 membrane protein [Streptomyces angustmyceticus]GES34661.1 membrane protein [Streptomyces angustmyceticus]
MMVPLTLMVLGVLAAAMAPRLMARSDWPDREPVLALWVWQCVVAGVLLCCVLAMSLSASAAWETVRSPVFGFAPRVVVEAYALQGHGPWAGVLALLLACGGAWTAVALTREVRAARARRRQRRAELLRRAPLLPGEEPRAERLVVLEGDRPEAWWLAHSQLVVTTSALRRLKGSQLDALIAHEQGHARARHDLLLYSASALAVGFPQIPVFAAFRDQVHRLVELAADDVASRRFGRLTIALALVELNEDRGVFGPCPTQLAQVPQRVDRLLSPAPRFTPGRRLRMTAVATLVPAVPLLVAFIPGLRALT